MIMTFGELPHGSISADEVPFCHRNGLFGTVKSESLIYCGTVKPGGNEPYCYTEEKQCAGHICRVLCPKDRSDHAVVVREDGTVWKICFSSFAEICRLDICT